MQASLLPPSFLDLNSLFVSSMGCWALRIVISFLVLCSICWSSSLLYFKNVLIILYGEQPRFLSLWWDSSYIIWFRVAFSFSWDTLVWCCLLSISTSIRKVFFSQTFRFWLDWVVQFLLLYVVSHFSLLVLCIFLCQILFLCHDNIIIIIIIIIIIHTFRVFHISVSWWFFTGVWVTTSLLKSPGLFSVFWPSSIMLSFGWSPLIRQLPNPPGPLIIL